MATFAETSIPSATITANSSSGAVNGSGNGKFLSGTGVGYMGFVAVQEITAVSALTSWDEKLQCLISGQTTWSDMFYPNSTPSVPVQFDQATGTGVNFKAYLGPVPSQLRTNYIIVGTSVTRIVNFTFAG